MATPSLPQSFGLGYLDEQQRFKRGPNHQPSRRLKPIMDVQSNAGRHVQAPIKNRNVLDLSFVSSAMETRAIHRTVTGTETHHNDSTANEATNSLFEQQLEQVDESNIKKKRTFRTVFPLVVSTIALFSGLAVFGLSIHQNKQAVAQVSEIVKEAQVTSVVSGADEGIPSEEPVSDTAKRSYVVISNTPRLITIEKIKVYARVKSMGILTSGALATPRNTNDAGWYNGSSKPGDGGASMIVGHAMGATGTGVFYNLKKLNVGDTIKVERGDGQVFRYAVVSKEQVPADKVDNSKMLLPVTTGKPGLNLMTCGGKFDAKEQTFDERILIYAEQI